MTASLSDKLSAKLGAKQYPDFIHHIRFPRYRSLAENLCITFDFPVTILVGANGSNKSSILRALQGAPYGRSVGNYWFSTDVDVIDEFRGSRTRDPQRFIYGFEIKVGRDYVMAECRKSRVARRYRIENAPPFFADRLDPDYWEPTKIASTDGMKPLPEGARSSRAASSDRWAQLRKPVVYLDFRSELSAFDKYFYHAAFSKRVPDEAMKKMKIIQKSVGLARALNDGGQLPALVTARVIQPVRQLSGPIVAQVSKILGRTYSNISILRHTFFGAEGDTVKLFIDGESYSEAHAGSGEFAVVRLVEEVINAATGSLILLDEPEVSLHPGAQRKLLEFLQEQSLMHGHQVVITSHSPTLVEALPDNAIKLLTYNSERRTVELRAQSTPAYDAFFSLGHTINDGRRRVFVEDAFVAELLRSVLRRMGPAALSSVDVVAFPGGVGGLKKSCLPICAIGNLSNTIILLDGDAKPKTNDSANDSAEVVKLDLDQVIPSPATLSQMTVLAKQQFGLLPDLYSDGNDGSPSEQSKAENLLQILKWARKGLRFLPGSVPEALVLNLVNGTDAALATRPAKALFLKRARSYFGKLDTEDLTPQELLSYEAGVIAAIDDNAPALKSITQILTDLLAD